MSDLRKRLKDHFDSLQPGELDAWFKDYNADKKGYLNGMLQELNWSVIEQRMMIAERANLDQIYAIQPSYTSGLDSPVVLTEPINKAPISPITNGEKISLPPIVSMQEGKKKI